MAAKRKSVSPEKPITLPPGEAPNPPVPPAPIPTGTDKIEVIKPHNLVIPDKMYERMHNIGNDAYWLRMIELHIETMMTRFHQ